MATLPIQDLDWLSGFDEGDTPIDAVAVIKVLDSEGRIYLAHRHTGALRTWDAIGMLRVCLLDVEAQSIIDTSGVDDDGS